MNKTGPLSELGRQIYETQKRIAKQAQEQILRSPSQKPDIYESCDQNMHPDYMLPVQKAAKAYGLTDVAIRLAETSPRAVV
uniref:hypothetical protein n=1 Tax=uncultured Rhizobium sp. TaxID=155567 RepID=UPI00261501DF|nr:hypothetical protein [uncultured Rhizobium sp.]